MRGGRGTEGLMDAEFLHTFFARAADWFRRAVAWPGDAWARRRASGALAETEDRRFEDDYAVHYSPGLTKPPDVGRPFFLKPLGRVRGGVVLVHGYMAAPLEVRALGEHLRGAGFAVYGVRVTGHGTAPEDLAGQSVAAWVAAVERGCDVVRALTDTLAVGGFSMGGCLALLAAARRPEQVRAVFTICSPLRLRSSSARLAPSLLGLNTILKRFGAARPSLEYVDNHPENAHINYTRNPLAGVRELLDVMSETGRCLSRVTAPALVVQASDDPTVHPDSAPVLFAGLGSAEKELTVFQRTRHGIVNGDGSDAVHDRVAAFLRQTLVQRPSPGAVLMEKAFPKPESTVDAGSLTIEADSGPEDAPVEEDEALRTLPSG